MEDLATNQEIEIVAIIGGNRHGVYCKLPWFLVIMCCCLVYGPSWTHGVRHVVHFSVCLFSEVALWWSLSLGLDLDLTNAI